MPTIDQQIREFQKHLRDTVNSPEFGKRYTPSEQVRIRGEFKKMLSTLADYQSRRDQADVAETADRENQALAEARKKTRAERNPLLNILGDLGTGVAETFAVAPATLAGLGLDIVGADDTAKTIAQGVADWREALETSLPSPEWNANNPESMLPGSDFIFGTAARNLGPMVMTGRATNAATRGLQALKDAPLSKGLQRAVNIGGTALGMSLPETYRDAMTTDQLGNVQLPKSPLTAMAMSVPHAAIEQLGVTPARLATLGNRSFIDALKRYARRHGVAGAAKHLVKHVGSDAIGESIEEPLQGVVGVFNRHLANKDFGQGIEDAVVELSQPETWNDLYQQSVGGLTTGALYSGGHIALGKINKKIEDPKTPVTEKQQLAMTKERLQIENQALLQLPYAGDASTVLPDGSSITDVPTESGRQALNITSILPDGTPVYGEGAARLNSPVLNDRPLLPSQATQELLPAPPSAVELGNMFLQTHARGDQVGAQALRDYAENRGALVTTPRVKVGGGYDRMNVRVDGVHIPAENRTLIRGDSGAAARLEKKIPQQQSNVTLPAESKTTESADQEVLQMIDDMIAERKRRGQSIPEQWLEKRAAIQAKLSGTVVDEGEIPGAQVFGHPQATNVGGGRYDNLVPIVTKSAAGLERRMYDTQKFIDELQSKIATAEAISKKKMTAPKAGAAATHLKKLTSAKAATAYLNSQEFVYDQTILELLKTETMPELDRMHKALLKNQATVKQSEPAAEPKATSAEPKQQEAIKQPATNRSYGEIASEVERLERLVDSKKTALFNLPQRLADGEIREADKRFLEKSLREELPVALKALKTAKADLKAAESARKKSITAWSAKSKQTEIKISDKKSIIISIEPDGKISSLNTFTGVKTYMNERGQFSYSGTTITDLPTQAKVMAMAIELEEADNTSKNYQTVIRPLQDKIAKAIAATSGSENAIAKENSRAIAIKPAEPKTKKKINEVRAELYLDGPANYKGLPNVSKRELMHIVFNSKDMSVEQQMEINKAAIKKDEDHADYARKRYLLHPTDRSKGSNENIPLVKSGYEAMDRLKDDKNYLKPKYVLFRDKEKTRFFYISKIEYDYYQTIAGRKTGKAVREQPEVATKSAYTEPKPAAEQKPAEPVKQPSSKEPRPVETIQKEIASAEAAKKKIDEQQATPPSIKRERIAKLNKKLDPLYSELESAKADRLKTIETDRKSIEPYKNATILRQSDIGDGYSFMAKIDDKYVMVTKNGDYNLIGNASNATKFVSRIEAESTVDTWNENQEWKAKQEQAAPKSTLEVFKGDDITFQFPDGRTESAYVQDATPVTRDGTPDQIYVKLDANGALRYLPKSWITKVKPSLIRQNKMDLAATEAKREAEAAKPVPVKSPALKPTGKIEDFGEVLHGAKKHYAEAYKDKLKASESVDEAIEPLSKSWPEPDYQQMIEGGADPLDVGLVRALRDLVPNKPPRGSRKMGRYLADLRANKAMATLILEGKHSLDQLKAFLKNDRPAQFYTKMQAQPFSEAQGLAILYATVGHKKSLKGTRVAVSRFSLFEGKEQNPPLDLFTIEQPGKSSPFSNMPRNLGRGPVLSEAMGQFKKNYDTAIQAPVEKSTRQTRIDVYKKAIGPNSGKFFLGHKIRATVLELKFFETSKEAREYLQANRAELEKMIADRKKTTTGRREENLPRTGKDLRDGRDITPAEFSSTFGFRGVQFGNWVEGQKRQENINEAYDALMDLAAALNIPPIAISLNGELGLAFGARGRGGERAAAAHYEQDSAVINLTKKRGAGSLAHEWLHGLDNFLAKGKAGISKSFYLSNDSRLSTARPEVAEAFNNLMKAINNTGLPARSKELDKTRSKDYWSTNVEMAARTFESYILRKLDASGIRNDFLVNTMGESSNAEDNKAFPYILESEIPTIIDTFDNLFNTLKQEKTEKGVKLYSVEYLVAKYAADGMKQAARVVRFGGNLLAKNVTKFAAWAKSMLKQFGSKIGKQLRSLYADLQALNKKLGRTGAISGRQVGLKNSDTGQSSPVSGKTAHEVLTAKWTKPKTSSTKKDTPSGQNVKSDKPRGKSPTELKQMVTSRGLVWKRVDKDTYELELTDPNTGKTSVVETIRRPKGTDNIWNVDNWTTFDDRGTGSGTFTSLKVAKSAIKTHARDAFNQRIYRENGVVKDRQRDEVQKKKRERGIEQDKARDEREAKQEAEKEREAQEYFAEKKTEPDNEPKKPKTWRDYAKNFIEKAEEILFDAWAPVRRLQESILKKHDVKELQDDLNLYQKLEVVSGKIEAGTRIFKSKFFDPIEKYLVENKIDYKSANRFLAIMHAEERNDAVAERNETYRITGKPGSGISSEQAAKEIEAHKKNGTYDKYLKFAKMTYRLNNALLDEQVRYGLLSQEQRDAYRRYKNYTPMKSPPDQGLILDRMALGRRSEATDQLTYIKAAVEAVFRRGERRDVIGAAMKLFAKFPDQKLYREFEPPKVQYIDKRTGKVRLRTDMSKLYNNPAVIWMKEAGAGVMRAFEIKDAALASALNRQYSGLGVEQKAFRYFAGVNRFLAGVSTAYNPEFIFTNLLRDVQQGAASVGVNLPDGSVKKFMTNMSRAKKAIADTRAGKITDDTKALEEFQLAGGKTGYSEFSKLEEAAEDLERKIAEAQAGGRWYDAKQSLVKVRDWIADWNDAIETRTRFAGYLTAKEAGLSTQKSAAFAKGMTINFNKKGTWAPVFNSLYLFSSASLGGTMVTASIINKARKTRKGRIMLAGAVGLGFVMELLNRSMAGDDDDEGVNYYDKVPDYIKDSNYVFMIPGTKGKYFAIPMPYGLNVLPSIGRNMAASMFGTQSFGTGAANVAGAILNSFNPVGGDNRGLGFQAIPTAVRPFIDIATNTSWTGRKIRPDQPAFGSKVARSELYFDRESKILTAATRTLNELTGGDRYTGGLVSLSPADVSHLLESYTGGVGRTLSRGFDTAARITSGEAPDFDNVPVVRRFGGGATDYNTRQTFKENSEIVEDFERARRERDTEYLKSNRRLLPAVALYKNTGKRITAIRKRKTLSESDKQKQILATQKSFNKRFRELRQN